MKYLLALLMSIMMTSPAHAFLRGGSPIAGLTCNSTGAAAANTALIQAALTAGGDVYLSSACTYWINDTLIIGSNTDFIGVPGTKLEMVSGVSKSLLQNSVRTGSGNTNILVEDIIFDGNAAQNQGTSFSTVDMDHLFNFNFNRCQFNNAWRVANQQGNINKYGEGIVFFSSQWGNVTNSQANGNYYDGFKTRTSFDISFTNVSCLDNDASCIQPSYDANIGGAAAAPSKRINVNGMNVFSTTGIPRASSPYTRGVYMHGAPQDSTIANVMVYGTEVGLAGLEYNVNNTFTNIVLHTKYVNTAVPTGGTASAAISQGDTELAVNVNNKQNGNKYSNIVIAPISGASGYYIYLSAKSGYNQFNNISMDLAYLGGTASGTWKNTLTAGATFNQFSNMLVTNYTQVDGGTSTGNNNVVSY